PLVAHERHAALDAVPVPDERAPMPMQEVRGAVLLLELLDREAPHADARMTPRRRRPLCGEEQRCQDTAEAQLTQTESLALAARNEERHRDRERHEQDAGKAPRTGSAEDRHDAKATDQ